MKKAFSKILLIIVVLFAACLTVVAVCGAGNPSFIDVTVMSDVHFVPQSFFTSSNYRNYYDKDKMEHISEAVMRSVADEIIKKKPRYLLISGDLTEYGDKTSHLEMAKILKYIEGAGINVFVINGNHDVATSVSSVGTKVTAAEFRSIYSDFGYNEAYSECAGTLSYSVNLSATHRLIAIDNIYYYPDGADYKKEALDKNQETWIKGQVEQCKKEGRTPVIMAHVPFLSHFPKVVAAIRAENQYEDMVATLADMGANYAFTGHMHTHWIKKLTSDGGNDFYDVALPSMIHFPCSYRSVQLVSGGVNITTVKNDYVNESYLSQYVSGEDRALLEQGLQSYSVHCMQREIINAVNKLDTENGKLGNIATGDSSSAKAMKLIIGIAKKAVTAPLYEKDETGGEPSVEKLLKKYGITVPQTELTTVAELFAFYMRSVYSDGYELKDTPEADFFVPIVYYALEKINEKKSEFAAIDPSYAINIDMKRLTETGKLECYDSGVMNLLLSVLGNNGIVSVIKPVLDKSFDGLKSMEKFVNTIYNGAFEGILDYFEGKDVDVRGLINDGLFNKYAPEVYWGGEVDGLKFLVFFN